MYFLKKFNDVKNNISKTWQTIKNVLGNGHNSRSAIETIKIGDDNVTNPQRIANTFNEFFIHVGPHLANKIPATPGDPTQYIKKMYPTSMSVYQTDCSEIMHVVQQLKTSTSIGYDSISPIVAKGEK